MYKFMPTNTTSSAVDPMDKYAAYPSFAEACDAHGIDKISPVALKEFFLTLRLQQTEARANNLQIDLANVAVLAQIEASKHVNKTAAKYAADVLKKPRVAKQGKLLVITPESVKEVAAQ